MAKTESFGSRIRQLRKALLLDQRTLAERVEDRLQAAASRGFDVSYLSKIENDRVAAPSIDVIRALASELDTDADELIALAGKVPPELGQTLRLSEGARIFFRSAQSFRLTEAEWLELAEELRRRREQQ